MFALTTIRRVFAATALRCGRSAYCHFLVETKNNAILNKASNVVERVKLAAKMYRALSSAEKKALEARAAKAPSFKHHLRTNKPYTRTVTARDKFFSVNLKKFNYDFKATHAAFNKSRK